MTTETLILVLAFGSGIFFGAIFFGGLWWTVRKGMKSKKASIWFIVSTLLRTSIVLTGFYFVSDGHFYRILLCLLGFVTARVIVNRLTQKEKKPTNLTMEADPCILAPMK
jgi:F1F0 ATPase subunit 2